MKYTRRRFGRLLVLFVVTLSVVLAGPARPAVADETYSYGDVSGVVVLKMTHQIPINFVWWQCSVVGVWKVATVSGHQYLTVSGGCERGRLADNQDGYLYADVPGCGRASVHLGNLDEKDEVGSFSGLVMIPPGEWTRTGENCGAPTQLCIAAADPREYPNLANGVGQTKCAAWNVGAPPDGFAPGNEPGTGAELCPRGLPLTPWVTEIHPVAVAGGWRWESEGTLRMINRAPVAGATIGGSPMYLYAGAYAPGGTLTRTGGAPQVVTTGDGKLSARMDLSATYPTQALQTEVSWKVVGPTKTTTFGTGAPSFQYGFVGFYVARDLTLGAFDLANGPKQYTTMTESQYAAGVDRARGFAGNHKPEWCYFSWGEGFGPGGATGPLTYHPATDATPPPAPSVNIVAPVINVGAPPEGGCPSGETCVYPGGDVDPDDQPPPSVPDPDDEDGSCDFSITNPTTWGGQLICAIVSIAKTIVGAIGDLLGFLGGLLADLLDLLKSLFIPDGDAWAGLIDGLRSTWDDGPGGEWADAFSPPDAGGGEGGGGGPGFAALDVGDAGCEGPEVDLGSLGLPEAYAPEPMRPFAACEGTAATVAEQVRKWTGIGLVVGGGFKIFEMVIGAFGAMRQVRIMSSHDWTGPSSGRF